MDKETTPNMLRSNKQSSKYKVQIACTNETSFAYSTGKTDFLPQNF